MFFLIWKEDNFIQSRSYHDYGLKSLHNRQNRAETERTERERLCNTKRFLAFRLPLDAGETAPARCELLAMIVQTTRVLTPEKF